MVARSEITAEAVPMTCNHWHRQATNEREGSEHDRTATRRPRPRPTPTTRPPSGANSFSPWSRSPSGPSWSGEAWRIPRRFSISPRRGPATAEVVAGSMSALPAGRSPVRPPDMGAGMLTDTVVVPPLYVDLPLAGVLTTPSTSTIQDGDLQRIPSATASCPAGVWPGFTVKSWSGLRAGLHPTSSPTEHRRQEAARRAQRRAARPFQVCIELREPFAALIVILR